MSKSLNKVMIIGHLGEDPSLRHTQSGTAVANLSIATNHSIKRGDQWEETVSWHRAVLWDKKAELAAEYLSKGSKVFIEGRLETKSWVDKENVKRYLTEIVVRDLIFLDSKGSTKSERPPTPPVESPGSNEHEGPPMGSDVPF